MKLKINGVGFEFEVEINRDDSGDQHYRGGCPEVLTDGRRIDFVVRIVEQHSADGRSDDSGE